MCSSSDFVSLREMSEFAGLESDSLLKKWLIHEVHLYIKLDSVSGKIYRNMSGDITSCISEIGSPLDRYMSSFDISEEMVGIFVTGREDFICIENVLDNSIFSSVRCSYKGVAHGFWEAKPSLLTGSGTGFYFAGNLHAEIKSMRSGTFFVYGVDGDYLTFEEDIPVSKVDFFIKRDDLLKITSQVNERIDLRKEVDDKEIQTRVSKPESAALYIMIKKHYLDKNGKAVSEKIANILTEDAEDILPGHTFNSATISRWLKKFDK
ncbi:hypothetical protein PUATCC27989T_05192 [Phytobacter ursingii]|mgnify:CR=1 FL=1|nr:hypothetical protein [Citrobacter sp.]AUU99614.1 hypothetical protein C2U51_00625 [Enterobacteriaceae bacterium ENNIH1]EKY1514302.1 hypothetical protein [Citrobacter freundii]MDU6686602.1 hypothetical protein [Enterobacteriaceae bacterium]VTP17196.1 hypothetical protein PUATCC27989T_05192 [Phytobacter ursingii]HAT2611186.1 hypothetical protein [Kluyvera intermedia]